MLAVNDYVIFLSIGLLLGVVEGYSRKAYIILMIILVALALSVLLLLPNNNPYSGWEWFDFVITFLVIAVGSRVGIRMGTELKEMRKVKVK